MKSTSNNQAQRATASEGAADGEFFNLHASGCGYLSRVRWVEPQSKGRKANPFLACAINALRGSVDDPAYTYFDLRVSGEEAVQIIDQLREAVEQDRKVFVAFKLGDFYAHSYERAKKDEKGRPTGEKEQTSLIKGRLLLITHAKVDGETVYQRAEAGEEGSEQGSPNPADDVGGGDDTDSGDGNAPVARSTTGQPARREQQSGDAERRAPRDGSDRTRVRGFGQRESAHA